MGTSTLRWLIHRIEKFVNLSATEQRKVVQAAMLVAAFRVGLWVIPYRILRPLADAFQRPRNGKIADKQVQDEIADRVSLVSYFFPEASCLTQALAAHVLLRREGFDPKLELGVARDDAGKFMAHAWIECDGRIVIGGSNGAVAYSTFQATGRLLSEAARDNGP